MWHIADVKLPPRKSNFLSVSVEVKCSLLTDSGTEDVTSGLDTVTEASTSPELCAEKDASSVSEGDGRLLSLTRFTLIFLHVLAPPIIA